MKNDLLMTLTEACGTYLNFSRNQAYRAAERGEIPGLIRFGSRLFVKRAEFFRAFGIEDPATATTESGLGGDAA